MADFGTDVGATYDLPLVFNTVSGNRNLGYAIVRRLSTARGALAQINPAYGPDYGTDIRQYLSSSTGLSQLQQAAQAEIEKDDRVLSVQVTVTPDAKTLASAILNIAVTTANGPFRLVLSVDQLTVQLLTVN